MYASRLLLRPPSLSPADAAGFALASGSHDCSVRFWDILGPRACIQESASHREKGREGMLDVEFHLSLSVMATARADSVVLPRGQPPSLGAGRRGAGR